MKITQSSIFKRFVKKQLPNFKAILDQEIKSILKNPEIGESKAGDLSEIRVHKFKFKTSLYLLSYSVKEDELWLVMIGVHENFYRDLKRYLKK